MRATISSNSDNFDNLDAMEAGDLIKKGSRSDYKKLCGTAIFARVGYVVFSISFSYNFINICVESINTYLINSTQLVTLGILSPLPTVPLTLVFMIHCFKSLPLLPPL